MSQVILKAECEFQDTELRKILEKMETRINTLNDRTKKHTLEIRELNKKLNK